MKLRTAISVLILTTFTLSSANSFAERGDKKERRGPPPEAFTACEALAEKDICTVVTPRGELSGTCELSRRDESRILCVPEDHKDSKPPKGDKVKDETSQD